MKKALLILSVLFSAFMFSTAVLAEKARPAVDACVSKAKDDACSFTSPKGKTIDGVCMMGKKKDSKMICVPKKMKEKFDACKDKAEGDACTFTDRKNVSQTGSCHKGFKGHMHCMSDKAAKAGAEATKPSSN